MIKIRLGFIFILAIYFALLFLFWQVLDIKIGYLFLASMAFYLIWAIILAIKQKNVYPPLYSALAPLPFLGVLIFLFVIFIMRVKRIACYPENSLEDFAGKEKNDEFFKCIESLSNKNIRKDLSVRLILSGEDYFKRLMDLIIDAKEKICIEVALIHMDKLGSKVFELLNQKGKEGVEVKIIFDKYSAKYKKAEYKKLKAYKHFEFALFEKLNNNYLKTGINNRMHRKFAIFDDKICLLGGYNIGDEYLYQSKVFHRCLDSALEVRGNIIKDIFYVFQKDWFYLKKEKLKELVKDYPKTGETTGVFLESGPDRKGIIREVYLNLINNAKREIMLASPYFSADEIMLSALYSAIKRGCRIQIMFPGKADKIIVNQITKSYYNNLLKSGLEIYEYKNTFVHSKILIADEIASLGSVNFDARSFLDNFESTLVFSGKKVKEMKEKFQSDLSLCQRILVEDSLKTPFFLRQVREFLRIFGPLV